MSDPPAIPAGEWAVLERQLLDRPPCRRTDRHTGCATNDHLRPSERRSRRPIHLEEAPR